LLNLDSAVRGDFDILDILKILECSQTFYSLYDSDSLLTTSTLGLPGPPAPPPSSEEQNFLSTSTLHDYKNCLELDLNNDNLTNISDILITYDGLE